MKKFLSIATMLAAFAAVFSAKADAVLEKFTVTPAETTAAVGSKAEFTIEWKSSDGSFLYAYFCPMERRRAAKGFFENTRRHIYKNPNNFNYDNIRLAPFKVMKNKQSAGQEKFTIDLSDFVPGKYTFYVNAKFMKDNTQYTKVLPVTLTVTPKVDPMFNKLEVTPNVVEALPGDTVEVTLKYDSKDGSYLYAWFVPLEQRNAPAEFFAKTKRTIRKHPTNAGYNNIFILPYTLTKKQETAGELKVSIQLYDFVPGEYKTMINAKFMQNGKQITRIIPFTIKVKKPAAPQRRELAPGEKAQLQDYIIYLDDNAEPSVKKVALRLQDIIFKASGVKLPIYNEPLSPMIAVGASPAAKKAGIDVDKIDYDGYVLKKINNDIFIVGKEMPDDGMTPMYGKSFGTSYGVYAFLEKHMGIYHLLPGEKGWYYPEITKNYVFGDINESFAPRFSYRFFWKIGGANKDVNDWIDYNGNIAGSFGARYFHSAHAWVYLYPTPNMPQAKAVPTREQTFRKNPDFFELSTEGRRVMPSDGQVFSLCLGNPATTEDIISRIPKILEYQGKTNPAYKGLKFYTLTPNDNAPYCACKLCRAKVRPVTKEMAGDAAYDLNFNWTELCFDSFRRVCEALPDYEFASYLYHSTQFTYPGIKPMPKNFTGTLAPLHCGYGPVRYSDKVNATWHNWVKSWDGILAKQSYYGLDFWLRQYYGAPQVPCLRLMNETFKVLRERPFTGVLFYGNTGFGQSGMATWVLSKMMYDPYQDAEKLGQLYLEKAYGKKSAVYMAQLWELVENKCRDFYNMYNGKGGWDMNTEMLADIYAPLFPELERLYLAAYNNAGDANQKWRLEMFGLNLKLLRYYLISLGFIEDGESQLRLTSDEYDKLNRARMPGGPLDHILSPAVKPYPTTISSNINAEITSDLAGKSEFKPFSMQTTGEFIIIPEKDGIVELEFTNHTMRYNPVKKRNYLKNVEFFSVYDINRTLLLTGMADKGVARFEGKKGKIYRFIYMPTGDFANRPYWYLKRCSEPFAVGHWHDGAGFRFYDVSAPVYFYVEPGTKNVDLYWEHTYRRECFVKLYDPSGKLVDSVQRDKADSAELHAKAVPGWWKIEFNGERGLCGYLRFGYGLSKYIVTDPSKALKITEKK